jgi:sterol desaturase/sphingolipid hydroxylase (fatty acid hydroxylase superfamily)
MAGFGTLRQSLERLSATRVNGQLGLVADTSVSIGLLVVGLRATSLHAPAALTLVLLGLIAFSFVEYGFHRWLFHGRAAPFEEGHRRHHDVPEGDDSLPFFFAPIGILVLTALLAIALPNGIAVLFAGGFASGYASYGLSHTIMHRRRFRSALLRRWAAAHHIHHHHPDSNFGVTSPLWDVVLGTRYARRASGDAS